MKDRLRRFGPARITIREWFFFDFATFALHSESFILQPSAFIFVRCSPAGILWRP